MYWETKNSCDLFHCDHCFTVVVWSQTCNITNLTAAPSRLIKGDLFL